MRILDLNLQHFGKFENRTISFQPGVNVICGGNETGKSTLHACIRAMLFGVGQRPGRGHGSGEYSLRQPWENGSHFAGKMRVEKDGKIYRIERNFYRNDRSLRLICETEGREVPLEGDDLSFLLNGMGEAAFVNTIFIPQAGARTDDALAGLVREYLLNLQESGDAGMNVTAAKDYLKKKRRDLEQEKKSRQDLLDEKITRKRLEAEIASDDGMLRENDWPDSGPADGPGDAAPARIMPEADKTQKAEVPSDPPEAPQKKDRFELTFPLFLKICRICFVIIGILGILCGIFSTGAVVKTLFFSIGGFFIVLRALTRYVHTGEDEAEVPGIAGNSRDAPETDENELEQILALEVKKIREEEKKKALGRSRGKQEALLRELEELYRENDRLVCYDREIEAYDLALTRITELSGSIFREEGTAVSQEASRILEEITRGRYQSVSLDEGLQVRINTPDHLLYLNQVSFGTMNQIWFALRMAAGSLLGGNDLPILLDETFSMYDRERLEAVLDWLDHTGRQVILFTCHDREAQILQSLTE